ncbi:hypothetical protein [Colwellia psychrerythraea]|uniref:hypothetical protein n=1 Tax=Colwellia psychrerythraea TaxID=28229 RepID=UPI00051A30E8|nr:hypothetical protein [Colwellia psychrerythraea]
MRKLVRVIGILIFLASINVPVYAEKNALDELHPNILSKKNSSCKYIEICGELVKMDCNSALDGLIYYFNNTYGKILMICGGTCMRPTPDEPLSCRECPLQVWQQCKRDKQN